MEKWFVVKFNQAEVRPYPNIEITFLKELNNIYHQSDNSSGFAVFKDVTQDGLDHFFLTPEAYRDSQKFIQGALYNGKVCDAPELSSEASLEIGDLSNWKRIPNDVRLED